MRRLYVGVRCFICFVLLFVFVLCRVCVCVVSCLCVMFHAWSRLCFVLCDVFVELCVFVVCSLCLCVASFVVLCNASCLVRVVCCLLILLLRLLCPAMFFCVSGCCVSFCRCVSPLVVSLSCLVFQCTGVASYVVCVCLRVLFVVSGLLCVAGVLRSMQRMLYVLCVS